MDLPPPEISTPMEETQKMDRKVQLLQNIKGICQTSVKALNFENFENGCNLLARAFFLDICNAENSQYFFSFKVASEFIESCKDRYVSQASDNPQLDKFHIDSITINVLTDILVEEGKDENALYSLGDYSRTFCALYTIMKEHPEITPEFTTFTFGGTMADMPPLRDKDGNPNMDFFRAWQDKTEEFFRSNRK